LVPRRYAADSIAADGPTSALPWPGAKRGSIRATNRASTFLQHRIFSSPALGIP
jgi:hypothetical protein